MKRSNILLALLVLSVLLFLVGLSADQNLMRLCAIGIMFLSVAAFCLTWVSPAFLSKKTVLTNLAVATSYAFIALTILIGMVFLLSALDLLIINVQFAVFGSMFVSMTVARFYVAKLIEDYI